MIWEQLSPQRSNGTPKTGGVKPFNAGRGKREGSAGSGKREGGRGKGLASLFPLPASRLTHPAKQYTQPSSCARATPSTPEGTTWTPGNRPATHSFFTASGARPIFLAAPAL